MMGQLASKIKGHYVTRNLQRYNVEARTEKILKADELRPSPRYPSDEKVRRDLLKDFPEEIENELHQKKADLNKRLKEVYVTSQDPSMETGFDPDINRKRPQNPDRPLPTSRTSRGIDRSAFSIDESRTKIKRGKVTLEKAQEMISTHRADLEKNTPTLLAQYYKLDLATTESVLEHFRIFGHVRVTPISAKQKQEMDDPYRAQPDWVEEAGEHPPVFDDNVIKEGILPKINIVAAKPLILEKESVPAIPSGHDTAKKELLSGSEQIKLNKSKKDNIDNDNK